MNTFIVKSYIINLSYSSGADCIIEMSDIERLLEESGLNPQLAGSLIRWEYTPINYSQPRFEKKKKLIENYLEKVEERTGKLLI